eukprot:7168532-Pyramimonas_sp.AAC.1
MAAVVAGSKEGVMESVLADGSRVWQESGEDELENGRLCRWTVVSNTLASMSHPCHVHVTSMSHPCHIHVMSMSHPYEGGEDELENGRLCRWTL